MKENNVPKAIIIAGALVAASIVIGSIILSRVSRFEKTGTLEVFDKRTGSVYILKGDINGEPLYEVVPGPLSPKVLIEPKYEK